MKELGTVKLNDLSEKEILKAVIEDGRYIQFIDNLSEAVQIEAVKQDGYSIRYIDNPSETVQIEAVKQDGYSIKFIDNPSETFQIEAVKQNGCSIKYIDNPSEQVKNNVDVIETSHRPIYVNKLDPNDIKFSIGCQKNITKDFFIWRIYNMDGGLEVNPYRQEYLDVLERY